MVMLIIRLLEVEAHTESCRALRFVNQGRGNLRVFCIVVFLFFRLVSSPEIGFCGQLYLRGLQIVPFLQQMSKLVPQLHGLITLMGEFSRIKKIVSNYHRCRV